MRIHTDKLTETDVYQAARRAGEAVRVTVTEHGSKSRARAFNVTLTGTSSRRPNNGTGGRYRDGVGTDDYAATWDEWGMFLGELFRRDPAAVVPNVYESGEHFRWVTGARFDNLTPLYQHGRAGHKWSGRYPNVTGVYYISECRGCEATHRRMAHGHAFAEISGQDMTDLEGV